MCLACEQDSIWLAYLESQGLLKPDDPDSVEKFFADFPVQELPGQPAWDAPTPEAPASAAPGKTAPKPAPANPFACDDPNAE
ncbi:MAG TPA: hypothetical protein VH206_23035 [Xanthobacteraceae bacterium]|jgi:hypothetical protein|nr:hypothetical protein [Xanthobacteraceae bacterium]